MNTDTPLEDLSHTNRAPTDIQRSSARVLVEKSKSKLSEMDADIARLQFEMTRLRLERAAVLDDVQRYEALLSSVRRLMNIPELISEIFIRCIPDFTDVIAAGEFDQLPRPFTYSYIHAGRHDAPIALSHVCRTWRQISLTTPRLWATFAVNARHYRSTAAMNLWLSRSRSYPLSFCIQFEPYESSILNSTDILALARHQNRWKNVSVNVKATEMLEHFLSSVSDTYPVLEKLHLSEDNSYIETYVSAPKLTQLELTGCFLIADKLHLPNLREIAMHDMWLDDCLSMCRQHQTLQRAVFHISSPGAMAPDADVVILPSLKDLHLSTAHSATPTDASDLLVKIRTPSLKKLRIESEGGSSIGENILPFLQRSSALLTSLHIDGGYSNMDSLVEFLSHIPHLRQLSLASLHLNSDDLLVHLQTPIITNTSTVLCAPELAVIGPLSPNPTLDSLVDFILSRRTNGNSALRDVVVPSPQIAFELCSHPVISECIKNGLQVVTYDSVAKHYTI